MHAKARVCHLAIAPFRFFFVFLFFWLVVFSFVLGGFFVDSFEFIYDMFIPFIHIAKVGQLFQGEGMYMFSYVCTNMGKLVDAFSYLLIIDVGDV